MLAAAAELPRLQLEDGLEVLTLMVEQSAPDRYTAGAARWCERLAVERGASLAEVRLAVAACELLPEHPSGVRVLRALTCGGRLHAPPDRARYRPGHRSRAKQVEAKPVAPRPRSRCCADLAQSGRGACSSRLHGPPTAGCSPTSGSTA